MAIKTKSKKKPPAPRRKACLAQADRDYIVAQMSGLDGSEAADAAAKLAKRFGISKQRVYSLSRTVRPRRRTRTDKKLLDGDIRMLLEKGGKTIDDFDSLIVILQAELKKKKLTPEQHTRLSCELRGALKDRIELIHRLDLQRRTENLNKQEAAEAEPEGPSVLEEFWRGYWRAWVLKSKKNLAVLLGYEVAPIHRRMLKHQADNPKRSLTLAPRGFGKSTMLTVVETIHDLLRDPNIRVCIISDTSHQARAFLYEISLILMTNDDLTWLFGAFYDGKTKWTETTITIAQRTKIHREGTVEGYGFDTAIVGRHFDTMRYDDPVSEENARTDHQRDRLLTKYRKKFRPCLMPDGSEHFVGTRYHFSDMYFTLMQDGMKDSTLVERAIVERRGREVSAWPGLFPIGKLRETRRQLGTMIFNCQYQNDTEAMKGSIFKYEWMRFCDRGDLPEELRIYQGVDLAIATKSTSDYFADVTVGYDKKTKIWYVLDAYHARLSFAQQVATIARKFKQFDAIRVAIEANAYQAAAVQQVRELGGVRVKQVVTHKDKVTRAMKLSSLFEDGKVVFLKGLEALVNELLAFPGAEHDDLFDALEIAIGAGRRAGAMVFI